MILFKYGYRIEKVHPEAPASNEFVVLKVHKFALRKDEVIFSGPISECESFIRLHRWGYIRDI